MLALVGLAWLDPGDPPGGRVQGDPGLEYDIAAGPVPELRAEHGGCVCFGHPAQELLERVRCGLAVVVQQPDPFRPVRLRGAGSAGHGGVRGPVRQCLGHGRAVAGRPVHAENGRLAELRRQHRAATVPAPGVDGDDALDRTGLVEQRIGDVRQPVSAVVGDDDGSHDVLRIRLG